MYEILIPVLVAVPVVMKLVRTRKAKSATMADALCHRCVYVHKVKGFSGKQLLFCNYGSELRRIEFAVSECTGFRGHCEPPPIRVAGFVHLDELSREEAFPATVIRIGPQ